MKVELEIGSIARLSKVPSAPSAVTRPIRNGVQQRRCIAVSNCVNLGEATDQVPRRCLVAGGGSQFYHAILRVAGGVMDDLACNGSMLSAFRDDYRQRRASGYKAGVTNSFSMAAAVPAVTAMAAPSTSPSLGAKKNGVWKWIDDHAAKYGFTSAATKPDPAHVQQWCGDWSKIALTLPRKAGWRSQQRPSQTCRNRSKCSGATNRTSGLPRNHG